MNQPTSIQMLDTAIWQEVGGEKADDAEAVYHALGTLLSRWLLARCSFFFVWLLAVLWTPQN